MMPRTKEELRAVLSWALNKGLPTSSDNENEAGIWANYIRYQPAPLNSDGELGEMEAAIRRDRTLFQESFSQLFNLKIEQLLPILINSNKIIFFFFRRN